MDPFLQKHQFLSSETPEDIPELWWTCEQPLLVPSDRCTGGRRKGEIHQGFTQNIRPSQGLIHTAQTPSTPHSEAQADSLRIQPSTTIDPIPDHRSTTATTTTSSSSSTGVLESSVPSPGRLLPGQGSSSLGRSRGERW